MRFPSPLATLVSGGRFEGVRVDFELIESDDVFRLVIVEASEDSKHKT